MKLPSAVSQVSEKVSGGDPLQTLGVLFLLAIMIAVIAFIVYMESARRKRTDQLCEPARWKSGLSRTGNESSA